MKQMFGQFEVVVCRRLRSARGELLHRHGFAGQGRLVDEQVLGRQQAQVAGDHVAGGQAGRCRRAPAGRAEFRRIVLARRGPGGRRMDPPSRRRTLARVLTMVASLAAVSFERCSWMKPRPMLSTTITTMTTAERGSDRKYETTASVSSRALSGFIARPHSSAKIDGRPSLAMVLGPSGSAGRRLPRRSGRPARREPPPARPRVPAPRSPPGPRLPARRGGRDPLPVAAGLSRVIQPSP